MNTALVSKSGVSHELMPSSAFTHVEPIIHALVQLYTLLLLKTSANLVFASTCYAARLTETTLLIRQTSRNGNKHVLMYSCACNRCTNSHKAD